MAFIKIKLKDTKQPDYVSQFTKFFQFKLNAPRTPDLLRESYFRLAISMADFSDDSENNLR